MPEVVIQYSHVCKSYGAQAVLRDFSLDVYTGELLTIIGRSGCGKTTALKLVNGLVLPDSGRVLVDGTDVSQADRVSLRRSIGYAIQNVGLFPHMTVEDNVAYVPDISGLDGWHDKKSRRERVCSLLELVGLDSGLCARFPRSLSGGQQQRVGIARALAADPAILLMDEPFGAVDGITRSQLQDELLSIRKRRDITVLFVTHDIGEALKLGSRVLVMDDGQAQQCAPPEELLSAPSTDFVRRLVSSRADSSY